MDRRQFLEFATPITIGLVYAAKPSTSHAQEQDEILNPILSDEPVWQEPTGYERLWRLCFVTFELRIVYASEFTEATGIGPPENQDYLETVRQSIGSSPAEGFERIRPDAMALLEANRDELFSEFTESFSNNVPKFTAWLESIGVTASGLLAIGLLQAQAFLSLFNLAQRGLGSLEERRAAEVEEDEECSWPFPFC